MSETVAIVGRPNVGKSTLFNRLVGKRQALVHDEPGVTRDRREGDGQLFDLGFRVIDTAGFEDVRDDSLQARMRGQTERALDDADVALLLIDARAGVTPVDEIFAQVLRERGRPVVLVANKCEGRQSEAGLLEAYSLGLGEPVPLSAEHGLGLADLVEAVRPYLREREAGEEDMRGADEAARPAGPLHMAIVGRPNVGKSTLVNHLIGEDRLLTGPEAGITRDAIAVPWHYRGREIRLVDTAGLRRRALITERLEKISTADSLRALQFAQVAVLMVETEAEAPLEKQDLTIARQIADEGRALVIALNKWDVCQDREGALRALRDRLKRSLPQTRGVTVVPVSALRGEGLDRLMKAVFAAYEVWNRRVPTATLNRWLAEVIAHHPPPASRGRRIRLKYITQARTRPPTFAVSCSKPEALPRSYLRYLENALREDFDLPGTPIRIHLKKTKSPYGPKD